MNNKYKITIEAPLLRAGMKIETECSEKYVKKVTDKLMEIVREINSRKRYNTAFDTLVNNSPNETT